MEIRINREIKEYTENVFLGLTLKQLICVIIASGMDILLYIKLRNVLPGGLIAAMGTAATLPPAVWGFCTFDTMSAGTLLRAIIKNHILSGGTLIYRSVPVYISVHDKKYSVKERIKCHIIKTIKKPAHRYKKPYR